MKSAPLKANALYLYFSTCALVSALFLSSCGGSADRTTLSSLVPSFGVSSPTAQISGGSSAARYVTSRSRATPDYLSATQGVEAATETKADIQSILSQTDASQCFTGIDFQTTSSSVTCYGPQLVYSNHPGGTPSFGGSCQGTSVSSGYCLPGGDLGIWSASETSGEACASAQLNSVVGSVAGLVNGGLKLMAAVTCVAQIEGKELPGSGESIDLTSAVADAVPGGAVTEAKLTRGADRSDGSATYQVSFSGTLSGKTVSIALSHSPKGNDYAGRLRGQVLSGSSELYGFSVTYSKAEDALSYLAKSAMTLPSAGTDQLFDASGEYQYTTFLGNSGSGNARYLLANVSATSGLGTVKFAWQAGQNDSKARVFNAHTTSASGGDTGYAYFGFGPKMGSGSEGTISGMCCNWAGPAASCSGSSSSYDLSGSAQNQVFVRNSSGVFEATSSSITFAPTNSCSTVASNGFKFALPSVWGTSGSSVSAVDVTHNLGSLTAVGTLPSLTAPVY